MHGSVVILTFEHEFLFWFQSSLLCAKYLGPTWSLCIYSVFVSCITYTSLIGWHFVFLFPPHFCHGYAVGWLYYIFQGVAVHVSRFNVWLVGSLDASNCAIEVDVNWKFQTSLKSSCAIPVFNRDLVELTKYDLRKDAFGQK